MGCEATIPHPYPFLKIRRPEQRPSAIFTVVNDEHDRPGPKMGKQCKKKFQQWVQNMKAEAKRAKQEWRKANKKSPKGKNQGGMKQPNSDGLQDYPEPKPSNAPAPEVCENKIQPVESPKVVTSTPNEASEAKIAQLMEVFSLGPEHRKTVTSFVMSQKATAEVSELASRFCEHVLPGLS